MSAHRRLPAAPAACTLQLTSSSRHHHYHHPACSCSSSYHVLSRATSLRRYSARHMQTYGRRARADQQAGHRRLCMFAALPSAVALTRPARVALTTLLSALLLGCGASERRNPDSATVTNARAPLLHVEQTLTRSDSCCSSGTHSRLASAPGLLAGLLAGAAAVCFQEWLHTCRQVTQLFVLFL
jgi:hypothetical protein